MPFILVSLVGYDFFLMIGIVQSMLEKPFVLNPVAQSFGLFGDGKASYFKD